MSAPLSPNGALTLVPTPGYEKIAERIKAGIETFSQGKGRFKTKVDIAYPEFGLRSSKEPFLRLGKEHVGGHNCFVITSGPGTYQMTGQLELLLAYLAGRHARRITVVSGYFPLGRSDKDEGKKEFALPPIYMKKMLAMARMNDVGFPRFISADLHAPQTVMAGDTGFITEVSMVQRLVKHTAKLAKRKNMRFVLDFPDDGSAERTEHAYATVEENLGISFPIVHGAKRRQSSTSSDLKEKFGDLAAIKGSIVGTLDDEWATGGTGMKNAAVLKNEFGAAITWMMVTHFVGCGNTLEQLADPNCPVDRLFITDTISIDNRPEIQPLIDMGRIEVVSWVSDLIKMIYFDHWNISIREVR
ncbi:MAG: hypothetical protein ABIH67_01405 [Candidatus Uhrbacteria bacterium]